LPCLQYVRDKRRKVKGRRRKVGNRHRQRRKAGDRRRRVGDKCRQELVLVLILGFIIHYTTYTIELVLPFVPVDEKSRVPRSQ
jgi:hypothetical protein